MLYRINRLSKKYNNNKNYNEVLKKTLGPRAPEPALVIILAIMSIRINYHKYQK